LFHPPQPVVMNSLICFSHFFHLFWHFFNCFHLLHVFKLLLSRL
jgi:hypothetical protein